MPIVKVPPSEPSARGSISWEEEDFFRNLIKKWENFSGHNHRLAYRLGEDTDGSPAVWIIIFSGDADNPSRETRQEIGEISDNIRDEIINSDFDRWPYFQIKAA
jgi:hypothetical protein